MENNVLPFASPAVTGREHAEPWYADRSLTGVPIYGPDYEIDADGHMWPVPVGGEFVRTLPEDIFVPTVEVAAFIELATAMNRPLNVSWMQMNFDPLRGCEVPVQLLGTSMVVCDVDADNMTFKAFSINQDPIWISVECVTDIALDLMLPEPKAWRPTTPPEDREDREAQECIEQPWLIT